MKPLLGKPMGRCGVPVPTGVAVGPLWWLFDCPSGWNAAAGIRPAGGLAAGVPVPGQRRSDASGWCSAWAVGRGPSGLGAGPLVRCSRQTEESGDLSPWRRGPVGPGRRRCAAPSWPGLPAVLAAHGWRYAGVRSQCVPWALAFESDPLDPS